MIVMSKHSYNQADWVARRLLCTIISSPDGFHNLVQVCECCQEALYQVQPLVGLGQIEPSPPLYHFTPDTITANSCIASHTSVSTACGWH